MAGELTPGALGRAALHDDPQDLADQLAVWLGPTRPGEPDQLATVAAWLRSLADLLDPEAP